MPEPISFEEPELSLYAFEEQTSARPDADEPFRVVVLGDFSARASRDADVSAKSPRRLSEIDRDNFDEVLRSLGVGLRLSLAEGGPAVTLGFDELEDFHPDRIYERLDIFRKLRQTRRRLDDPSTFEAAAAEIRGWAGTADEDAQGIRHNMAEQATAPAEPSSRDLIGEMLSQSKGVRPAKTNAEGADEFGDFLREVIRPHLVSTDEAQKAELTGAVDAAAGQLMRAVLHHPGFQAVEAAWRGLHFLVMRTETGTELKLYLLDYTREELSSALDASGGGALAKLLADESNALGGPVSLVACDYVFGATHDDAELLTRVARLAGRTRAPFIAEAGASLFGCESLAETPDPDDWREGAGDEKGAGAWAELRRMDEARYVGLAAPRFLLRLPYGAETEPAERFEFEEFEEGEPRHADYLWGNPAFVCAQLLAEAFARSGWAMRSGEAKEIEGLPLHVYRSQGESRVKPCAEVSLTERAAERMMDRGVMPLVSYRDSDTVRVARFQSIADPPTNLSGRWG
jgi:type VI secretion system protein ImpC